MQIPQRLYIGCNRILFQKLPQLWAVYLHNRSLFYTYFRQGTSSNRGEFPIISCASCIASSWIDKVRSSNLVAPLRGP